MIFTLAANLSYDRMMLIQREMFFNITPKSSAWIYSTHWT